MNREPAAGTVLARPLGLIAVAVPSSPDVPARALSAALAGAALARVSR
jgi:hypothetical protein